MNWENLFDQLPDETWKERDEIEQSFVWDGDETEEEMREAIADAVNDWAHGVAQELLRRNGVSKPTEWDDYLTLVAEIEFC